MKLFTVKRLTVLFLVCVLAAACASDEAPHSDYFVITFLPNTPAPSNAGVEALGNAARQAGRHAPAFIAVSAAAPDRADLSELTLQRIAAITQAFVREGVDLRLIRTETLPYDANSYGARKDSFIVQLAYGR